MVNPQMRVPSYYLRFMQLRLQLEEVIACRTHGLEPPLFLSCSWICQQCEPSVTDVTVSVAWYAIQLTSARFAQEWRLVINAEDAEDEEDAEAEDVCVEKTSHHIERGEGVVVLLPDTP